MPQISMPTLEDWQGFSNLAAREGWRVPAQELELLRGPLRHGAFVLKREGEPLGFVTAVAHEKSGWVGNLIVPAECRGRGFGSRLFAHALEALEQKGVASVWLTASAMGRPLYERLGFRSVGGVVRWVRPRSTAKLPAPASPPAGLDRLLSQDHLAWGESRRPLLEALSRFGRVYAVGGAAALAQGREGERIIGPWNSSSLCPRENRLLLQAMLEESPDEGGWVADVIEASPLAPLLAAAGFAPAGRTELMVRGEKVDLERMVALATLGSLG